MQGINITYELIQNADRRPYATALLLNEKSISFSELNFLVWKCAGILSEVGLRPGNPIGVQAQSELMRAILTLALMRIGITVVPIARSLTVHQVQKIAQTVEMKYVVSDFAANFNAWIEVKTIKFDQIKNQKTPNFNIMDEEPINDCLLVPGSGSTGRPKIIPQTHQIIRDRVSIAFYESTIIENEVILSMTNLEFASGINRLLSTVNAGGAFALLEGSYDSIAQYCATSKITTLFSSVYHIEVLLKNELFENLMLFKRLNAIRVSGSNVSLTLRNKIMNVMNSNLNIVYGANECGRIAAARPPEVFESSDTVGMPLKGVEVSIVDSDDKVVSNGSVGKIRVKTSSMIRGYVGDQEATIKNFRNGWFYTGDVGKITTDGILQVFGRSDRMMIFNGINIYPAEIEQVIKEVTGVQDVVVLPLSHSVHQNIPIAVVSTTPGIDFSQAELKRLVVEKMGFKSPKRFYFVPEIPRNSNGKLQMVDLVNMLKN